MCVIVTHILYFVLLLSWCRFSLEISCKNENGKDVDWYVNYKLPLMKNEPRGSNLAEGMAYAYITAPGSPRWKLSSKSIDSGSMLEKTMDEFYENKKKLTYLFYNDEAPAGFSGTSAGHLKGVVAFDSHSGFWLIHSVPRFGDDEEFEYPENGIFFGQSILCVTFKTSELNEICNQLIYSGPNIYASGITEEVEDTLDDTAGSLFTDKPAFVRKGKEKALQRIVNLRSLGGKRFVSFAKDNQYEHDLYSEMIAPHLKTSLLVETWRRKLGTIRSPACDSKYYVHDVLAINMTISSKKKAKSITFKFTEDHSKWAISVNSHENWICVADINRMVSQGRRGGGALCFTSAPVRRAYDSIINEVNPCPTRK